MSPDSRIERVAEVIAGRTPRRVERTPDQTEAAVSLVLRPGEALEILLVRRAERDSDPWSGHIGLPGGRREAWDEDLAETALRETEEETGIALAEEGRTIGWLDEVIPVGPGVPSIVVAPLVGAVPAEVAFEVDPRELVDAAWAPLSALRDPTARTNHVEEFRGRRVEFPAVRYGELVVWGLTYRILTGFFEIVDRAGV